MSCTETLLGEVSRSVEAQLRPRLTGLFGSMIRAYLPQTWEFRTEEGATFLMVGADGTTRVARGASGPTDVTLEIPHDTLAAALRTRQHPGASPPGLKVTAHTKKGQAAFDYLRSRLGL